MLLHTIVHFCMLCSIEYVMPTPFSWQNLRFGKSPIFALKSCFCYRSNSPIPLSLHQHKNKTAVKVTNVKHWIPKVVCKQCAGQINRKRLPMDCDCSLLQALEKQHSSLISWEKEVTPAKPSGRSFWQPTVHCNVNTVIPLKLGST